MSINQQIAKVDVDPMDPHSFSRQTVAWHGLLIEFEFTCHEEDFGRSSNRGSPDVEIALGRVGLDDVVAFERLHPHSPINLATLEALVESNDVEITTLAVMEAHRILARQARDWDGGYDGSTSW
jgi:hypothetical protein